MPTSGRSRRIGRQPTPGYWRWITSWTCQLRLTGCLIQARQVDHNIPVARGGEHSLDNTQAALPKLSPPQIVSRSGKRPQRITQTRTAPQRHTQRRTRTATTSLAQSKRMAANLVRDISRGDENWSDFTNRRARADMFSHCDRVSNDDATPIDTPATNRPTIASPFNTSIAQSTTRTANTPHPTRAYPLDLQFSRRLA